MSNNSRLQDGFQREIRYLRLSVTPHCNLRCSYCQPNGPEFEKTGEPLLSPDEIARLAGVFARLGVRKIRLTGGEPTLRPDLLEIVERLAAIPEIEDLSLSTHALFLEPLAAPLAAAGLGRVNISLDTLREDRFTRIAGREGLGRVLAGIAAARKAGLAPLKINTVPLRGVNDDEIGDFLSFAAEQKAELRFIELMPLGVVEEHYNEQHIGGDELLEVLGRYGEWQTEERNVNGGPARQFVRKSDSLRIGLINPLAPSFCEGCNRVRITATGEMRNCLFGPSSLSLRRELAEPDWERSLEMRIRAKIAIKPEHHNLAENDDGELYSLARVGG